MIVLADFLRMGQRLYYINKFNGNIEYVIITGLYEYDFRVLLNDGRLAFVPYSAVGPRLIPVSDVYHLPRCGVLPSEIGMLSWYNSRPRVYPMIFDVEIEKANSKPPKQSPCDCCTSFASGLCEGYLPWCDDFSPIFDYFNWIDELSRDFERHFLF